MSHEIYDSDSEMCAQEKYPKNALSFIPNGYLMS